MEQTKDRVSYQETYAQYEHMSDEELVEISRNGQKTATDYLIDKYRNLVKRETREVYIIGADSEDLMQEGMIGLFKAIRDYMPDKNARFYTFATRCIKGQICTAVTKSNRKKNAPLNNYISFYAEDENGNSKVMDTLIAEDESNPEETVIWQERLGGLLARIDTELSRYERQVLQLYLNGLSYAEIAERLDKTEKSIDNAIQRIRKKLSAP